MSETRSQPNRSKSWKVRLAALGLGLGLVGLIEVGLRIAGVAEGDQWSPPQLVTIVQDGAIQGEFEITDAPHFTATTVNGAPGYQTSESYQLGRGGGFPAQGAMRLQQFTTTPEPGIARYIVLGGSAAMGQNPGGGNRKPWVNVPAKWPKEKLPNGASVLRETDAISGQLENLLHQAGHPAEVINAGMIAQDSGAVRDIALEVLEFNPTGLILYLGNNEGIGLSQAMNGVEVPTSWPGVQSVLHESRMYRVLAGWILPARQRAAAKETVQLQGQKPEVLGQLTMAQWASVNQPLVDNDQATDEVYLALLSRFESNLRNIVEAANERGVEVYVIPTPPHLAYPPFYTHGHDPRLSQSEQDEQMQLREQTRSAIESANWAEALRLAEAGEDIDPFNSAILHQKGRALHELGRTQEALEALSRSHMLDISRKRTQPAFNDIAQQVCSELGCQTTSAHAALLERAATEGVEIYDQLLGDHEHLNPEGNRWIASLFAELILR